MTRYILTGYSKRLDMLTTTVKYSFNDVIGVITSYTTLAKVLQGKYKSIQDFQRVVDTSSSKNVAVKIKDASYQWSIIGVN